MINTWPVLFTELIHLAFTHRLHISAVVYSHLHERNISTPVTVDDVGARLLPLGLEVPEFSIDVAPLVLVAGLQEVLGRHQSPVHQNAALVLAAVDLLDEVIAEALRDNTIHVLCNRVFRIRTVPQLQRPTGQSKTFTS